MNIGKTLLLIFTLFFSNLFSQEKLLYSPEVINWEVSGAFGTITNKTSLPYFQKTGFSIDSYLPFRFVLKKDKNIHCKDSKIINSNILLSIRQSVGFLSNSFGSMAFGFGNRFSLSLTNNFFLDYELGLVWVTSSNRTDDGLYQGLSFKHFYVLKRKISSKFSLGLSIMNLSNAGLFSNKTNYDMISLRAYYSFF